MQSRHSKLYCLCSRDIQNFIVCAVATFKTLLFVQSRHSKLYCLCSRDIQNFIVCAVATFKTLFVQSSHSKLFSLRVPSGAPYPRQTYANKNNNILKYATKNIDRLDLTVLSSCIDRFRSFFRLLFFFALYFVSTISLK